MDLTGWVEYNEKRLSSEEIITLIDNDPMAISKFGGEFFIRYGSCFARDHYGIIQGDCPPGIILCNGNRIGVINPEYPEYTLEDAIKKAVTLRSDEGITALSGGVDSALVAALSRRPCLVVGMEGCHDIRQAGEVATRLDLPLHIRTVLPEEIADALPKILNLLKTTNPVDVAISTTLFFVAETARDLGYERILTGQGADELFGGYARYLETPPDKLGELFITDFASLERQGHRDQSVAGLFKTYLSMPYLDLRVVKAAEVIPPEEKVCGGVRKRPLREVAVSYLTETIAYQDKKAMQYGTGIWKEIKHLARREGNTSSVTEFLTSLQR
jgi:asparagine synthase (glutamine-hydrolysing)